MLLEHPVGQREFKIRLREAAIWCSAHLRSEDPRNCLRHKSLMPAMIRAEDGNETSWDCDFASPAEGVDELCRKRAAMLAQDQARYRPAPDTLQRGRLLVCYPYESLCDGAAQQSSSGFFDIWNIPPWDTWIALLRLQDGREALYSWVPDAFVPLADSGIWANPEQCIQWLDSGRNPVSFSD